MFVDLLQDITERRHLDTRLRQAQKMEAVGQLAGGIAHDFNNILMAMFGYIHLVKAAVSDRPDAFAHLEQLQHASERAAALVKQILTFSRQSEVERQPVALQAVIEEVLSLLRATLPSTIEIRTSIDPACGMILADPTELHQVLMNLCTNATYAMWEHGGVLELGLCPLPIDGRPDGSSVQLHVRDTGTGMSSAVSERIFEPFFTTKSVDEGTGMGLSVVHGIVQRNEGTITVESAVGQGTTFVLQFPVIPPQPQEAVGSSASELFHGTEHILFVDDESGR